MKLRQILKTSWIDRGGRGIVIFCLLVGLSCEAYSASPNAANLLRTLGFSEMDGDPINFKLTDMEGKTVELSDYRGKWVWLTFWATWCGPCEYELPRLESVYQEFKDDGLVILGVSVDSANTDVVKRFVESKGLSFPIVHDSQGAVSQKYQSSAVPTIYVISPNWRVAGVFRGAKNWEASGPMAGIAKLLKAPMPKAFAKAGAKSNSKSTLALPTELEPPRLEVEVSRALAVNEPATFLVRVHWVGEPSKYLIKVPKLQLPKKGVVQKGVSSSTRSQEGESVLSYAFTVEANETGKYVLGPVELAYQPRQGGQEQFTRASGVEVEVSSKSPRGWVWAIALFVLALAIGLVVFLRKKKVQVPLEAQKAVREDWKLRYQGIKELKVQASRPSYVAGLLTLYGDVLDANGNSDPRIRDLVEKVKFGGMKLSEDQLRHYERQVENLVKL